MKKKILVLGVTLVMCLGFFVGCGGSKNFDVVYDKMGAFGSKTVDGGITYYTLAKVSSAQELQTLCAEFENPAFQEDSEYYSNELSQKIRSYTEMFFSEKSLIVYSFGRGHDKETRIDSISVEGTKLIVNASYKIKKGVVTNEGFNWLILLEVNKADTAGANTIQVVYK